MRTDYWKRVLNRGRDVVRQNGVYGLLGRLPRFLRLLAKNRSRGAVQRYWTLATDDTNAPETYTEGEERSAALLDLLQPHIHPADAILEIGCNVGRNLDFLYQRGYRNLYGIDINQNAIELMSEEYPEMAAETTTYAMAIEEIVDNFEDRRFDVTFSMATFQHVHPDSEWVFEEVARITGKLLVTIDREDVMGWNTFPRDYGEIFSERGFRQVEQHAGDSETFNPNYTIRVFRRWQE